jgi:hypothetical protein
MNQVYTVIYFVYLFRYKYILSEVKLKLFLNKL